MAFELARAYVSIFADDSAMNKDLERAKGNLQGSIGMVQGLAAGLAGGALAGMIGFGIKAAADAETASVAYNVVIKDLQKTNKLLAELQDFSVVTPFTPEEVRKAGLALVQVGVPLDLIRTRLEMLGDLAAGGGGEFQELVRIFNKINMTGKLTGETFEQLVTQGINIMPILQDMLGKTGAEIFKMREKGELTADVMLKAFQKMTQEGGLFYQAMIMQSKTFWGLFSTLQGVIQDAARRIGEQLLPAAKALSVQVIEMIGWFNKLNDATGGLAGVMALLATTITTVRITLLLLGTTATDVAKKLAAVAWAATGPWGIVIAAIGAVILGLAAIVKWFSQQAAVAKAWELAVMRIKVAWDTVWQAITTLVNAVLTMTSLFLKSFGIDIPATIEGMKQGLIWFVAEAIKWVSDMVLSFAVMFQTVLENWDTVWSLIKNATLYYLNGMLDQFLNFPRVIGAVLVGVFDLFVATGRAIGETFWALITDPSSVMGAMKEQLGLIADTAMNSARQVAAEAMRESDRTRHYRQAVARDMSTLATTYMKNRAAAEAEVNRRLEAAKDTGKKPGEAEKPAETSPFDGIKGFNALDQLSRKLQEAFLKDDEKNNQKKLVDAAEASREIQMKQLEETKDMNSKISQMATPVANG